MVTGTSSRRRKASLHISLDAGLSKRLRHVAEVIGIPLSHLTSLAISRAVREFELELHLAEGDEEKTGGVVC